MGRSEVQGYPGCFSFISTAGIKYSEESGFDGEVACLSHTSRLQTSLAGKPGKELEAANQSTSAAKSREKCTRACIPDAQLALSTLDEFQAEI